MLRRLSPFLAMTPLILGAPAPAIAARPPSGARPLAPAPPPEAEPVSGAVEVPPAAPRSWFSSKLPRREPPEAPGAPPPPEEETPEERARRRAELEDNWLDTGHAFVAERLFAPVIVFDRFFSDETTLDVERSRSFVRWRNELRLERGAAPTYATSLRADLRLPALNRVLDRLRFVLEGQTRDVIAAVMPGDADENDDTIGNGGAELRLRLWDGLLAHGDLGAGVLLDLPPGAFTRARLRWAIPAGQLFLTRIATSGFWRTDTRLGTSFDLSLERGIKRAALLRLSGQAQLTQVSRGVEWSSELAAFRAFSRAVAGSVGAGLRGATDGEPRIERYRVATRARADVYRRWLFVELEPEVFWPWTEERGRHVAYALTFRVEVQFRGWDADRPDRTNRGASKPPEPAAPPPPAVEPGRAAG